ncbi:hypothetical protein [Nocardioides ginkgobilobae]
MLTISDGFLMIEHQSVRTPAEPIQLHRLTGARFEAATRWTAGILTIAIDGQPLSVPTGTRVGSDPRTAVFKAKDNTVFEQLHRWLLGVASQNLRGS